MELESDSRPPENRPNQPRFNLSHPLQIMLLAKMRIAGYTQGNRVKKLCGDEACKEVVIPGGDFAAESEGILSPGSPD